MLKRKYVIFSLDGCRYSQKAEKLVRDKLDSADAYEIVRVHADDTEKDLYKQFNQMTTVPQVFVEEWWKEDAGQFSYFSRRKPLGGYDALKKILS